MSSHVFVCPYCVEYIAVDVELQPETAQIEHMAVRVHVREVADIDWPDD